MEITKVLKAANLIDRLQEASAKLNELRALYEEQQFYTIAVIKQDGSVLLRMNYADGQECAAVNELITNFTYTVDRLKTEIEQL